MAGTISSTTRFPVVDRPVGSIICRDDGLPLVSAPGPSSTPFHAALQAGPVGGVRIFDDFLQDAGATLPAPLGKQDTSAAGTPTLDYSADAAGGAYVMKLDTTNEAEKITLYFADQLVIDITKKPLLQFRMKIEPDVTGAGGDLGASDIIVAGLASARNATLDSVTTNAWFRFEGANHNILWETDDGTTDDNDNDTGINWADNTYALYTIDASSLAAVRFFVNGVPCGVADMSAATGNLQFFIEVQKAAAANMDHRVTVDFFDVCANR